MRRVCLSTSRSPWASGGVGMHWLGSIAMLAWFALRSFYFIMLELRWQASVDGEDLTEAELAELAESKRSIIRLRDQWVRIDSAGIRRLNERRTLGASNAVAAAPRVPQTPLNSAGLFSGPSLDRVRRAQPQTGEADVLELGDISLDSRTHRAAVDNNELRLTGTEFEILKCLLETPGQVVNKEYLSERALGRRLLPYDRSVDTHISNLRGKLEKAGNRNETIQNQRGVGYLLIPGS